MGQAVMYPFSCEQFERPTTGPGYLLNKSARTNRRETLIVQVVRNGPAPVEPSSHPRGDIMEVWVLVSFFIIAAPVPDNAIMIPQAEAWLIEVDSLERAKEARVFRLETECLIAQSELRGDAGIFGHRNETCVRVNLLGQD